MTSNTDKHLQFYQQTSSLFPLLQKQANFSNKRRIAMDFFYQLFSLIIETQSLYFPQARLVNIEKVFYVIFIKKILV